jgi:hypothetical protein
MESFIHPKLGPFDADSGEWLAAVPLTFPCTGYSASNISIVADENLGPGDEQFQAVLDLIEAPPSFRGVLAEAMFQAYSNEIRPEYLERIATEPGANISTDKLPELQAADEIWWLIDGVHSIRVNENATLSIDFRVMFDAKRGLHVAIKARAIERVWMEK